MPFRIFCYIVLILTVSAFFVNACKSSGDRTQPTTKKTKPLDEGTIAALPLTYKTPADNPSTPEKIELGRLLFYDPILSGSKDVACATCHHPEFGYAESIDLSIGVNGTGLGEKRIFRSNNNIPFVKRNAPSILNTAFNGIDANGNYVPEEAPMFWDNRAKSLEEQVSMPVKAFEEMRGHGFEEADISVEVEKRLNAIPEYRKLFAEVFPEETSVSFTNVAKAIATFERSLIANNSRFDQYMRGDKKALSSRELDGMRAFMTSGCARCHSGPMLSNFKPHLLGVAENKKLPFIDSGFNGTFAFRTPTLRNLRLTRPYMHNGTIQTLDNVLLFYEDLHGKELANKNLNRSQLDSLAVQLKVQFRDIDAIIEFLNTLNDNDYDRKIPEKVPSGLPVGGKIK
ncbi:MAG: cytochrome-c peroxidase [Chitinophagaceae bacterium]|nr:cytochrome-c peroxidase [Chitinophagaceae bacterium]